MLSFCEVKTSESLAIVLLKSILLLHMSFLFIVDWLGEILLVRNIQSLILKYVLFE